MKAVKPLSPAQELALLRRRYSKACRLLSLALNDMKVACFWDRRMTDRQIKDACDLLQAWRASPQGPKVKK